MLRSERLPTNYSQIEGLEYIDNEDLLSIEQHAKFLEIDDCLITLFIVKENLSEYELDIIKQVHARGRKTGIISAGDLLFRNMQQKTGTAACLEYLRQFSGTFSAEIAPTPSGNGFAFNVIMPDEGK